MVGGARRRAGDTVGVLDEFAPAGSSERILWRDRPRLWREIPQAAGWKNRADLVAWREVALEQPVELEGVAGNNLARGKRPRSRSAIFGDFSIAIRRSSRRPCSERASVRNRCRGRVRGRRHWDPRAASGPWRGPGDGRSEGWRRSGGTENRLEQEKGRGGNQPGRQLHFVLQTFVVSRAGHK